MTGECGIPKSKGREYVKEKGSFKRNSAKHWLDQKSLVTSVRSFSVELGHQKPINMGMRID